MGRIDLIYSSYREQHVEGAAFSHILEMQQSRRCIWGCHAGSQRGDEKGKKNWVNSVVLHLNPEKLI